MTHPGERIHSLDAARALAMLLGIFLHAALPYSYPGFPWPVIDDSRSLGLTLLLFVLHAFRMSVFFLVAGFFARMLHDRLGFAGFVRHRLRRILLPLVLFWLLLFPLLRLQWAWGALRSRPGIEPARFVDVLSFAFDPARLAAGLGFAHLWFLYYLLLLYGLFLAMRGAVLQWGDADRSLRPKIDAQLRKLVGSPWELPALAAPTTLLLLPMRGWGIDSPDASLLPQPRTLLLYCAFFAFGWLLGRQPGLLDVYGRNWLRYTLAGVAACVPQLGLLYLVTRPGGHATFGLRVLFFANYAFLGWALSLALVALCVRFLARPHSHLRYVADASYWMYLVHLPLVLLLGFFLAAMPVAWPLKLVLANLLVVPLLLGSYHLLVRFTWLGVLLNGRRAARPRQA